MLVESQSLQSCALSASSCLRGLLTPIPLCYPAFRIPASLQEPCSSSPFPLLGSRGCWEDRHSGQTGLSQDPVQLWGGDLESWTVGTCWGPETCMGRWCLKTLAADSSSCGDQQCPHGPDVGLTHLPPAVVDLQRTSQPISEKTQDCSFGRGPGGPPSTSNGEAWQALSSASKVVWTAGVTPGLRVYWGRWGRSLLGQVPQVSCPETRTKSRGGTNRRTLRLFHEGASCWFLQVCEQGAAPPEWVRGCCQKRHQRPLFQFLPSPQPLPAPRCGALQETSICRARKAWNLLSPAPPPPPTEWTKPRVLMGTLSYHRHFS